ncbi:MAG: hypothetical protein KatS3mg104_2125 [Phycisphaerae bacterium]|nr:MAG: hypothetical protein KatS3mg104_2125 [Phycisphaerae bacterium]
MTWTWTTLDTWIVVCAAMAGMACAVLGNFLVLRKMSLMGDAISHALLPGIVAAVYPDRFANELADVLSGLPVREYLPPG